MHSKFNSRCDGLTVNIGYWTVGEFTPWLSQFGEATRPPRQKLWLGGDKGHAPAVIPTSDENEFMMFFCPVWATRASLLKTELTQNN